VQLNSTTFYSSTFHFDSSILTLLTVIDSSLLHITAVSKHQCRLTPLWRVYSSLRPFQHWRLHPNGNETLGA